MAVLTLTKGEATKFIDEDSKLLPRLYAEGWEAEKSAKDEPEAESKPKRGRKAK